MNNNIPIERRKMNETFRALLKNANAPEARSLTTTSTGYLVPQEQYGTLFSNLLYTAPLLDYVTVQETLSGRPTTFPAYDPTLVNMQVQSEGSAPATEVDPSFTKTLQNYTLATAKTNFSNQILADSNFDLIEILKSSGLKQMGRFIDFSVVAGTDAAGNAAANSANLLANAPVGATTSALANGIQWTDIINLLSSVDHAFAVNGSFVGSYGTYIYLLAQKTTTGARLYPELADGKLGKFDFIISAAMHQTLAANNIQLLFGDLSQIATAHTGLGIQVIREAAGLVESNLSQLLASTRVSSLLMIPPAVKALKLAAG